MFMRSRSKPLRRLLLPVVLTILLLVVAVYAVSATQKQMAAESLRLTEESVRRAAVQCYALEGAYATDLEYLIDNFGIRPDTNRFLVHYMYLGDNLLPDITVIPY
ncbi:MAG: hypothetical protein FWG43_03925 [Clostridiales bacterium]|nr:hypothetical protein [Clostridiales bacterium]